MQNLMAVLYGMVFGIANIIPGVSGGTMLVTFGCFDKVCGALSLNLKEIKKNLKFLIFFGAGTVVGILGFSYVISYLFENFPTATYLFFIGLIGGSVPLIYRNATAHQKLKPSCIIPFVVALAAVVGLTVLEQQSGEDYLLKTDFSGGKGTVTFTNNSGRDIENLTFEPDGGKILSVSGEGVTLEYVGGKTEAVKEMLGMEVDKTPQTVVIAQTLKNGESVTFNAEAEPEEGVTLKFKPKFENPMTVTLFLSIMGAALVASVAMIIPGVSGSFMMVLMGMYTTVISAVKDFNLEVMIPFVIGVIPGFIFGARLIRWLLKKFRLMVFSAILGLVIGSVYAILPTGFGFNAETLFGLLAMAAGAFISLMVGKHTEIEK